MSVDLTAPPRLKRRVFRSTNEDGDPVWASFVPPVGEDVATLSAFPTWDEAMAHATGWEPVAPPKKRHWWGWRH